MPPPLPTRAPAREFDTLPDADVLVDHDDSKPAPSSPPPLRARTQARRPAFKLAAAATVLMALAGTAFAMHSHAKNESVTDAPKSTPKTDEAAPKAQTLLGPSAGASELKFTKDPKPASTRKPKAKTHTKSKATTPRHS